MMAIVRYLVRQARKLQRGERGQVMVIGVMFVGVVMGAAAIAVDTGSYMSHRRNLQNDADAIALAASQGLPASGDALALANEWAELNGIDAAEMTITITPQSLPNEPNPKIKVELATDHALTFMRVLGMNSAEVAATATSIKTSPGGGNGMMPWSVLEEDKDNATPGDPVVLKYDASGGGSFGPGNFGPIRIDGNGSNVYENSIKYGSENTVCALGVTSCNGPSVVSTETGNKTGGTRDGVDYRLENTSADCDTWAEAVIENADGSHTVNPACNPWGGNEDSLRLIIVPVIDESCNGNCDVTILEFVLFFLDGYGEDGCTGNSCEIEGRYIQSNTNMGTLQGTYDADTFVHFVRLTE